MLYQDFDTFRQLLGDDVYKQKVRSDDSIRGNLNPSIALRDYQEEALGRLMFYMNDYSKAIKPVHLLFNMATGSGKTVIMASAILHLYSMGYRNFVFFTRLGHIVEKTRINFLESAANKYLFSESIFIDGRQVKIAQVNSFEGVSKDDINILFTTTAGLHTQLNNPQENSVTFDALSAEKLVLIADEAHNLSAETTKGGSADGNLLIESWESTVSRILIGSGNQNVLLEFTATARLEEDYPEVIEKYKDKAIFKYDLKEYRMDGYSKDVSTLEFDAPIMERVLVALLLSQYRLKVAEKYRLRVKPVVLLKSNRVSIPSGKQSPDSDESVVVSSIFKARFHDFISNLSVEDLDKLRAVKEPTLQKAFQFFDAAKLSSRQLVQELRVDFDESKCLTVDDKSDLDTKQYLLNTLEDPQNQIRAVFATEKLNEGWDVLNLFDIVRLYNSRDASNNKAGKTTVQEAQLIGRGARYYPFPYGTEFDKYRRKFDNDSSHELRILEELYYHSKTNPRYIQELRSVLTQSGIISDNSVTRISRVTDEFKETKLWKEGLIFVNAQEVDLRLDIDSFASAGLVFDSNSEANTVQLSTRLATETQLFGDSTRAISNTVTSRLVPLKELGLNVIRAALDRHPMGNYRSLKVLFGGLESMHEFISSDKYLGSVRANVRATEEQHEALSQEEKLYIAKEVLSKVLTVAKLESREFIGSKTFRPKRISEVFAREKHLRLDPTRDRERLTPVRELELETTKWFAQNEIWGTSEEKALVLFVNDVMSELSDRYQDIYLLRNEKHFPIFSFKSGEAFYPDFVLFLSDYKKKNAEVYQLFIEPKGDQFLDSEKEFARSQEAWKQEFLEEINEHHRLVFESEKYRLVGLPFFNRGLVNPDLKEKFVGSFRANLKI